MGHLILETIEHCLKQTYPNMEIIVYDDCSTDNTINILKPLVKTNIIKYYRGVRNIGVGEAFNRGMSAVTGDFIVMLCADDLFTNDRVITDIASIFRLNDKVGYITRWYYQFTKDYKQPVRAWRSTDPVLLANNPSGLAFRRKAITGKKCINEMFVETSHLAHHVLMDGWDYRIMQWDTIAVRVHDSTSTQRLYWKKRFLSSPVAQWRKLGVTEVQKDYVSFIQIKNGYNTKATWMEIKNFIKFRPINLFHPAFWFYAVIALLTPRRILVKLPKIYRKYLGKHFVKAIKRP